MPPALPKMDVFNVEINEFDDVAKVNDIPNAVFIKKLSDKRALGYGASALEFGFGFIQYFIHPNRRTVHDRIAETIVVKKKKAVMMSTHNL